MALSRVQATGKVIADGVTSVAVTFAAPPTVGNGLIVALITNKASGALLTGCTDNQGHSYGLARETTVSDARVAFYYLPLVATSSAPFTITVTTSTASSYFAITAIEVGGVGTGLGIDQTSLASAASGTAISTGSTLGVVDSEVFVVAAQSVDGPVATFTVETVVPAWTAELRETSFAHAVGAIDSRLLTGVAGTPVSCSWTNSASGVWTAAIVAFRANAPVVPITLVTSVTATPGTGGGATSAINTTGARLLIVSVSGNGVPAISDSKANTWASLTARTSSSNRVQLFYVLNAIVGPSHTFTVTGSNLFPVIHAYAFACSPTTGYVLLESGAAASASPLSSGSLTPLVNGALIVTGRVGAAVATDTITTSGFTLSSIPFSSGVNMQGSAGYYVQPTAAAINPTWSWTGGSATNAVASAVFAELSGTVRLSQLPIEVLRNDQPLPTVRLSQLPIEVLRITGAVPAVTGRLTQLAVETLTGPLPATARLTQLAVEVLTGAGVATAADARLTQLAVETLSVEANVRLTQLVVETLAPETAARLTQLAVETLSLTFAREARATQLVTELLTAIPRAPVRVTALAAEVLATVPPSPVAASQVAAELILGLAEQPNQARVTQLCCELIVVPLLVVVACPVDFPVDDAPEAPSCPVDFPYEETPMARPPDLPAVPTLLSVTPTTGAQGTTVAMTLTGTGFVVAGTTVTISGADVVVGDVTVTSPTLMSVDVWIAPGALAGARSVTVTTAGGTGGVVAFTVTVAVVVPVVPTLTSLTPSTGVQGAAVVVTLTGTGFVVGATTVTVSGTGVTASAVTVTSTTGLTATLAIAAGATVSARTVTVTTTGGTSGSQAFTVSAAPVTPAVPTLTAVTPATGVQGTSVAVTLTGTGLVVGATTVSVSGSGVTVSSVVVLSATTLTATFAVAGGATVSSRSVRVTTVGGTSGAVAFGVTAVAVPPPAGLLVPGDLTLLGYIRLSDPTWSLYYGGGLALRRVGDQTRLFSCAYDGSPVERKLVEFIVPAAPPTLSLATAPRLLYHADHGSIWDACFASAGVDVETEINAINFGAIAWDEALGGLHFSHGDPYGVSPPHYPTLNFAQFAGESVSAVYGPWRTTIHPNRTCGSLVAIPADFAAAHLGGARFAVTMGSGSGAATRAAGCSLAAITNFTPATLPPATAPNPPYDPANGQVETTWLFDHDREHPQARDDRYKMCFWWELGDDDTQHYNCAVNNHIEPGPPLWGGNVSQLINENDSISGVVWIRTATKRGLLFTGQLTTTPPGYVPPGSDPDGLVHCWYGDPTHGTNSGSGYEDGKCCHGQNDPYWGATGGGSHYHVPHLWIYDDQDLIPAITGAIDRYSVVPHSVTQVVTPAGNIALPDLPSNQMPSGFFGSPVFDAVTSRLYVMVKNVDAGQPVIAVYAVAG